MRFLVKWPSRGRPEMFFATLTRWLACLSGKHNVTFLFAFDADDVMANQETQTRLRATFAAMRVSASWLDYSVRIHHGRRTKIEAINSDIDEIGRKYCWDTLVLASDDMWPAQNNVDELLCKALPPAEEFKPRALLSHDGHRHDGLCTIAICTRTYYDQFGYVYHPSYKSVWCDNEWCDVAKALNQAIETKACFFEHQHPFNDKLRWPWDDMYREQCSKSQMAEDHENYEKRKALGVMKPPPRFDAPDPRAYKSSKPVLSILIVSIEERETQFKDLCAELQRQCLLLRDPTSVEVQWLVDSGVDNGGKPVGEKRQQLLQSSNGDYVCFVDDDDMIAPTYVRDLLVACQSMPAPDCVVFRGALSQDGRQAGSFDFGLEHEVYKTVGDLYLRTPNHLCPIKREYALKTGFKPHIHQEDNDYARRVFPLLKTQVAITEHRSTTDKKVLYHYRFSRSLTRTQRNVDSERNAKIKAGVQ